jgi:hypothetical protein
MSDRVKSGAVSNVRVDAAREDEATIRRVRSAAQIMKINGMSKKRRILDIP